MQTNHTAFSAFPGDRLMRGRAQERILYTESCCSRATLTAQEATLLKTSNLPEASKCTGPLALQAAEASSRKEGNIPFFPAAGFVQLLTSP